MTKQLTLRLLLALAPFFACCAGADAQKTATIYVFGTATSLGDSVVYLSDIQELPSVLMNNKTSSPQYASLFSRQMEDALTAREGKRFTASFHYATTKKKIEKIYLDVRKHLRKGGHTEVRALTKDEFQYAAISSDASADEVPAATLVPSHTAQPKGDKPQGERPQGGQRPQGGPGGQPFGGGVPPQR